MSNCEKPNIIFMMTDDQRYDAMGFMGDDQAYTPNIDKLAAEGVRFRNAFHVAPICMPSRATVQLGKYISQHHCGFEVPTDYTITKDEYQESYPVLLRKNGYYTGFIGKFGFNVTNKKVHNSKWKVDPRSTKEDPYMVRAKELETENNEADDIVKNEFDVWNGVVTNAIKYRMENGKMNGFENKYGVDHLIDFNTCQAYDFLDNAAALGKPFALSLCFKAPHRPLDPQKRWLEHYENMTMKRKKNDAPEYFAKLPEVVRTRSRNAAEYWGNINGYRGIEKGRKPWVQEEAFQHDFRRYYALISGVDESVGLIRKKLEELGLDKNTIIIYTSDNGYFCGSKQLGGKELLYEESIKAPMIVYDPRLDKEKQSRWVDGMISHIDICPTILDYAGLSKTENMPGHSFAPLVKGEVEEINDAVYGENDFNNHYAAMEDFPEKEKYQSIRSKYVRTKKFKYIRYHECHPVIEELWAIDKDPLETNNLVNNPEYKDKLDEMRKMLDDFIARCEK